MGTIRHFDDEWLLMPDYKEWLRKVPEDSTKFKCIMCHKSYSLSTAGKSAVTEHNEGKKHKALVNKKMNFLFQKVMKLQKRDKVMELL